MSRRTKSIAAHQSATRRRALRITILTFAIATVEGWYYYQSTLWTEVMFKNIKVVFSPTILKIKPLEQVKKEFAFCFNMVEDLFGPCASTEIVLRMKSDISLDEGKNIPGLAYGARGWTDMNETSSTALITFDSAPFFRRSFLAHELAHAAIGGKLQNRFKLPELLCEGLAGMCEILAENEQSPLFQTIRANAAQQDSLIHNRFNVPGIGSLDGTMNEELAIVQRATAGFAFWHWFDNAVQFHKQDPGRFTEPRVVMRQYIAWLRSHENTIDWVEAINRIETKYPGWKAIHTILNDPNPGFFIIPHFNALVTPPEQVLIFVNRSINGNIAPTSMIVKTLCGEKTYPMNGVLTFDLAESQLAHCPKSPLIFARRAEFLAEPWITVEIPKDLRPSFYQNPAHP